MKHILCALLSLTCGAAAAEKAVEESNDYYQRPLEQLF